MKAFASKGMHPSAYSGLPNGGFGYGVFLSHVFKVALVVMLFCFGAGVSAEETDLIQSVEIYEDAGGQETIETVATRKFEPSSSRINKGYSKSAYWLRVTLKPSSNPYGDILLQVSPTTIDSVRFFQRLPDTPHRWRSFDAYRDLSTVLHGIHIHSENGLATIYLRVETAGVMRLTVTASDLETALRSTVWTTVWRTIYLTGLAILAVWAARMAFVVRDRIFWLCAVQVGLWITHNLYGFGLVRTIPIEWISSQREPIFRSLVFCVTIATVAFHHELLSRIKAREIILWALRGIMVAVTFAAILYVIGLDQRGLQLNAYCIAALPLCLLLGALSAPAKLMSEQWQIKLSYIVYAAILQLWAVGILGGLTFVPTNDTVIMTQGAATGLLMLIVLNARRTRFLRQLEETKAALNDERLRATLQREQNSLLARFIDMMAHETRNAHAVVRMNISAGSLPEKPEGRIISTLARLDGFIERSVRVAQLEAGSVTVKQETVRPADLVDDVLASLPNPNRLEVVNTATETIQTDHPLLKVALCNLVENALKYSPDGSKVRLVLESDKTSIAVSVQNEVGSAGAPNQQDAFRKFYRGQGTRSIPGTGLGLYLVRTIAQLLGGDAEYERLDQSVRFTMRLPC